VPDWGKGEEYGGSSVCPPYSPHAGVMPLFYVHGAVCGDSCDGVLPQIGHDGEVSLEEWTSDKGRGEKFVHYASGNDVNHE